HDRVARPHLLAELHRVAADVARAQPVGGVAGEDARLQHADREDRRVPGGAGELFVVVDRVEVTGRALVFDHVGAGDRAVLARRGCTALVQILPAHHHDASVGALPVSIIVVRDSATTLPLSSRYSVTISAKRMVPPRFPSFSYTLSIHDSVVSFAPARGG